MLFRAVRSNCSCLHTALYPYGHVVTPTESEVLVSVEFSNRHQTPHSTIESLVHSRYYFFPQ
ncbi:hypothetical protein JCM15093_142 [Bacteroides graminisolvens DSM 19988 = JCM 15093]|uniref:Uncharacterized protein n=1 Tax=Bacteroides graminisolvens DSM 19988 = JCM 15093 TaxID=1121097 RepID=A0A069CY10_9BACE|nr:hypothetical protein JCM15093_142 [Bacteroides graminisolvens DSM 19988 = JCM 15093]